MPAHLIFAHALKQRRIKDTEAAAKDGLVVRAVGEPDSRTPILPIRIDESPAAQGAVGRLDDATRTRGVEIGLLILAFEGVGREVPAQAQIYSQLPRHFPVVLRIGAENTEPLVYVEHVGQLRRLDVTKQAVGVGASCVALALAVGTALAGENVVKIKRPSCAGLVHEDIARIVYLAAEFERVRADEERDAVDELELLRGLIFSQENQSRRVVAVIPEMPPAARRQFSGLHTGDIPQVYLVHSKEYDRRKMVRS